MSIYPQSNSSPFVSVVIQSSSFDLATETLLLEAELAGRRTDVGALATFTGSVRASEHNAGDVKDNAAAYGALLALDVEHYPAMTQSTIEAIVLTASQRWDFLACKVIHRVGRLAVGEPIVMVLVASSHRKEAVAACGYIIDYLKNAAPFWKKAIFERGEQWVDAKLSDSKALDQWL